MIKKPGRQPTKMEQMLLTANLAKRYPNETLIIHHISEDTKGCLQLEVELRGDSGIKFERIIF